MTIHHWNNHKIEVKSHSLPKYLWMILRFSVEVDGKDIFQGPTSVGFKDVVDFKVIENENMVEGKIITLVPCAAIYTRYKLVINNIGIEKRSVTADNWYMLYGLFSVIILGIIFL